MFTPGFKLFFGFAMAALFAGIAYAFFSGDKSGADAFGYVDRDVFKGIISLGWDGSVGDVLGYILFATFAGACAFLGITLNAFRDADVESVAELNATGDVAPSQGPTEASWWPVASALGVGVFIVGLGTSRAIWIVGLAILAVVAFEWMLSAWSDRATGDPEVNRALRRQVMGPIEVPVVALAGVAVVALAISRVLLAVSASAAVWIAGAVALAVLLLGWLFAARPELGRGLLGAVVAISAIGIIAAGVVSAAVGQRDFHHEEHGEDHSDEGDHSDDGDHSDEGEAMTTTEAAE